MTTTIIHEIEYWEKLQFPFIPYYEEANEGLYIYIYKFQIWEQCIRDKEDLLRMFYAENEVKQLNKFGISNELLFEMYKNALFHLGLLEEGWVCFFRIKLELTVKTHEKVKCGLTLNLF